MMALSKGHGDGALTDRRGGLYRAPAHEQTRKIGAVEGVFHICENLKLIDLQAPPALPVVKTSVTMRDEISIKAMIVKSIWHATQDLSSPNHIGGRDCATDLFYSNQMGFSPEGIKTYEDHSLFLVFCRLP